MRFHTNLILIIIMVICSAQFVLATPIEALDEYYQATVEEDFDRFIAIQDTAYFDAIYEDSEFYINYFKAAFEVHDTKNYEIINPFVQQDADSALIFYTIKSDIVLTETDEKKHIENDLVALLINDNGWKVRYIITHEWYEYKLISERVEEMSFDLISDELSEVSLVSELKESGQINLEEYDKEDDIKDTKSNNWLIYIIILIIILIVAYTFKSKKLYEKVIIITKKIFEKIKPVSEKVYKETKPLLKKVHVKIKEVINIAIPKIKHFYKKTKTELNRLLKR